MYNPPSCVLVYTKCESFGVGTPPSWQCHTWRSKVLLLSGPGATTPNTTVLRNTSKALKETKITGGVKIMPSVFFFFQFLSYFGGKLLFLFFMKQVLLSCALYSGPCSGKQS